MVNQMEKRKPRILIVDDNPENIQVLGTILKTADYLIHVGRNGVQALEIAAKVRPDLILMDIMMPEMDGMEACRRLKQSESTRQIPVIFLTAKAESTDIAEGFKVGALDYVIKPFKSMELLARVETHLELKFNRELIAKQSTEQKELIHILCHDLTNPFHNIQGILELLEGDLSEFETYAGYMRTTLANGLNIIDLVRKMRSLEEKKNLLEVMPLPLKAMITESLTILRQKIADKNIKMEIEVDSNIKVQVEKTSFVNSVVNNLISNSVKFSFQGSAIVIQAHIEEEFVILSIRDYGIGMPEVLVNDLFDVSKPTSRAGTGGETGTGFGMPLVKKFMEAYGGSISIRSSEKNNNADDHGTEVKLYLPKA